MLAFTQRADGADLPRPARLDDVAGCASGRGRAAWSRAASALRERVERFAFERRRGAPAWPNHVVRDAAISTGATPTRPRDYLGCSPRGGYAVVGRTAARVGDRGRRGPRRAASRPLLRALRRRGDAASPSLIALPGPESGAATPRAASCRRRSRSASSASRSPAARATDAARVALHARRHGLLLMRGSSSSRSSVDPATRPSRRRCRRSARSRRASTRWSCWPTARSPASLPANCACGCSARRRSSGAALRFERALARELRRGRRASSRTCARSTSSSPRRSSVRWRMPLVLWYTHWKRRARRCGWRSGCRRRSLSVDRRSFPLDSSKVRRDRARHRPLRVLLHRRTARGARPARARRSAATRRRRGSRRSCARRRARDGGLERRAYGPASRSRRAHRARARARARERARRRASSADAVLRSEVPELFARADVLVNNMRAGAPDKVVYEAARLPAGDRVEPGVRHAAAGRARASSARTPRASPSGCARSQRSARTGAALGRDAARAGRASALGRTWADGILEAARAMTARPPPRRRSPASPARRRTCSRCCRGCASAAGTSGC